MANKTPGAGPPSQASNTSASSNKVLIAIGACVSCCLSPFLIGLVIGIATMSHLCELYHKYWSNPFTAAGAYIVAPAISFITDIDIKGALSEYCGSTMSSSYSLIPCGGDFEELAQKYLGKHAAEMRGIMKAAGIMFHDGVWCADFTAFFIRQLGYDVSDFYYPHTRFWYKKFKDGVGGWRLLGPGEMPQPGDIVMKKNFSHTCMFYQAVDSSSFHCFGGNQGGGKVTKTSKQYFSECYFGRLPGR